MHEAWDSTVDSSFQQSTWVQLQSKAKKRTEEKIDCDPRVTWTFLVLAEKNPPTVQETQETRVQSLVQKDPLDKGMATSSSIKIEEPGKL